MHYCRTALIATTAAFCVGCAARSLVFESADIDALQQRAVVQTQGPVSVSAAVLGRNETQAVFGLDLYAQDIQPLWLEIRNSASTLLRYAPVSTDANYFAPLEIAYMNRSGLSAETRERLDRRFDTLAMRRYIYPGDTQSGFVFTHVDTGAKALAVDLAGDDYFGSFTFLLRVPGFEPDYAQFDSDAINAATKPLTVADEDLYQALRELPCCVSRSQNTAVVEPVNMMLLGRDEVLLGALLRSGWRETSAQDTAAAQPAYLFDRPQDATFRYALPARAGRYEMRLWLAPVRVADQPVWAAQVQHVIGEADSARQADADVDAARFFAVQKFLYAQTLHSIGWIKGDSAVAADSFWDQRSDANYFSDGYRVVIWLSDQPTATDDIEVRDWDQPPG